MERRNLWAIVMYVTLVMMMTTTEVESSLHRVGGGKYNWNPEGNFSDWASHESFYSGDWLYFGFDRTRHNILQVNKSSYENCIDSDFIFNVTRGGRDVFQLVEPKPYYFICGKGYCLKGMKLAVNVIPQPPPPSTPTVPITPAASTAPSLINAFTTVATSILTAFTFKSLYFD